MKEKLLFSLFLAATLALFVAMLFRFGEKQKLLGEGYRSDIRPPVLFVTNTSTARTLHATSTLMVNRTTSTFEYGRFYVDQDGNVFASGTFRATGASTFLGGITVTGGCTGCGTSFGESWVISNNALTPSTSFGIHVPVSSTFQDTLHVTGILRTSSTAVFGGIINDLVAATSFFHSMRFFRSGYTSIAFPDIYADDDSLQLAGTSAGSGIVTISSFLGVNTSTPSSTLSVHGNGLFSGAVTSSNIFSTGTLGVVSLSTLTGGLHSGASSTFQNSLHVTGAFNASSSVKFHAPAGVPALQIGSSTFPFVVDTSGKVGLGTTTPFATLSISDDNDGTMYSFAKNNRFLIRGDGVVFWGTAAGNGLLSWDTGKAIVGGQSGSVLELHAGGAAQATLDTVGLGLGNTTPAAKLHVTGSSLVTASSTFQNSLHVTGNLNASSTVLFHAPAGVDAFAVGSSTRLFTIGIDGKAGAGTSTPGGTFSISDTAANGVKSLLINNRFVFSGDGILTWGATPVQGRLSWDTGKAIVGAQSGQNLSLHAGDVERIFISSDGRVGINTATPESGTILHVVGSSIFTASSSFANDLTVSRNLMSSGTIALADGYTMKTALKSAGGTILSVTTTDIITMRTFDRAVTIRSVETVLDCPSGCNTPPNTQHGIRFNFRHGTNRVVSTTADSLFTNDVFAYSSTTILSYCPSGTYSTACTLQPAWGDNTLAANETLWFTASTTALSASTSPTNLTVIIKFSED